MNPAYQSGCRKLIKVITQKAEQDTDKHLKPPAHSITEHENTVEHFLSNDLERWNIIEHFHTVGYNQYNLYWVMW